jgi:hypothetical protein
MLAYSSSICGLTPSNQKCCLGRQMRLMIGKASTVGLAAALKVPPTAHANSCDDAWHKWQVTTSSDRLGDGDVGDALGEGVDLQ